MSGTPWTAEEVNYLRVHWQRSTDLALAEHLGRSANAVKAKRIRMGLGGKSLWTQEEEDYLREAWGKASLPSICAHLGRSTSAVRNRISSLALGPASAASGYITFCALLRTIYGGTRHISENAAYHRWTEAGLPVIHKRFCKRPTALVDIDVFWTWAGEHRDLVNFSQMEPLALGVEPGWVAQARRKPRTNVRSRWTEIERQRLAHMVTHGYNTAQVERALHRPCGAIWHQCKRMGIPLPRRETPRPWSEAELETLRQGLRAGRSYLEIGLDLGRSTAAVKSMGQQEGLL